MFRKVDGPFCTRLKLHWLTCFMDHFAAPKCLGTTLQIPECFGTNFQKPKLLWPICSTETSEADLDDRKFSEFCRDQPHWRR